MSDNASKDERTEDATPRRRQQYRDRGEVAKSQELASAFMLTAGAGALALVVLQAGKHLGPMISAFLSRLHEAESFATGPGQLLNIVFRDFALTLGPGLGVLAVVAVSAHIIQTGPMFSLKAMEFKPDRLNPFPGFKRIFMSKEAIANLIKTIVKVVTIGAVAVGTLLVMGSDVTNLVGQSAAGLASFILKMAAYPMAVSGLVMLVVGVVHFAWQKRVMNDKMKMTKEEAKREHKENEGDPLLKGRRRQKHRDLVSLNQLIETVPTADVVINNPTHISVAIRYLPTEGAPVVVAIGADHVALKIRDLADEHDILMIENVPLARALHSQAEVGQHIPESFYKTVSEVLAFVMKHRGMKTWVSNAEGRLRQSEQDVKRTQTRR